ncbi:MAG: hypothetical protein AB1Z66_00285, partial [Candidatus Limnocylindrales bacterium]
VLLAAALLSTFRVLSVVFEALDVVALVGLFFVLWLGNGGALVPIPGARFIGLLLIFNQAAVLPSLQVFAVAGAAMGLGLSSYYVAGARTARSYAEGDAEGAEQIAADSGMLDDEVVDFAPGAELDTAAALAIAGVEPRGSAKRSGEEPPARLGGLRRRFNRSLQRAQDRAQPVIEQRGFPGIFLLTFGPTPMGPAAAYLSGLMRFGFARYLLASFAAKYLLAGVIVLLALAFSDVARAVEIPELHIPIIDITLFDDGLPDLPGGASPMPSLAPAD